MNKKMVIVGTLTLSAMMTGCVGLNAASRMASYLESYEFEKAYNYYSDKVDGSKKEDEVDTKIEVTMNAIYDSIVDKYSTGDVTETDISYIDKLAVKASFNYSEEYDDFVYDIGMVDDSISNYENVMSEYDKENYSDALSYFNNVSDLDSGHYEDAQNKISECKELVIKQKKEEIAKLINDGKYEDASWEISIFSGMDSDAANELYSQLESKMSSSLEEKVNSYFDKFDYNGAYNYVVDLYNNFGYSFIEDKMNNLEEEFVKYSLDIAKKDASNNNYEAAQSVISQAIDAVGEESEVLANAYEEYRSYLPVYINDLDYMSNVNCVWYSDILEDNTGALYHKALYMCDSYYGDELSYGEGSAEYYIDGNYASFTGTVAVPKGNENSDKSAYFEIYGDGKLIYTSPVMTKDSFPETFNINVTGVKMLKISYPASNTGSNMATLYDGLLTPAEASTSEENTEAVSESN